jgi:prepilin-type N-terminal cleavage/methylation domain-containing protein
MKKTTVKGFTLIEMLIVLATFSVIMFGALQLMQPSRALYERSFKEEDASAGEKILKAYLEDTLRYAQNMDVTDKAYTDTDLEDDLITFVNNHYNGYRKHDEALGSGVVNVIWIDNRDGGKVSSQSYTFTAPDINPKGVELTAATITSNSDYKEFAVNRAIYNRYNYVLSLGATTTEEGASDYAGMVSLKTDEAYYNKLNSGDISKFPSHIDECCPENFMITINAYDTNPKVAPKKDDSTGVFYYSQIMPMTASMSLVNLNADGRENYLHLDWVQNAGAWEHPMINDEEGNPTTDKKWCNLIDDTGATTNCHLLGDSTGTNIKLNPQEFTEGTFSNYANPDTIRIIYSYPLK